jgi:hypothetical protein
VVAQVYWSRHSVCQKYGLAKHKIFQHLLITILKYGEVILNDAIEFDQLVGDAEKAAFAGWDFPG